MMKNVLMACLFIGIVSLTGCRKASVLGEASQCIEYATEYSNAALAFYDNQTKGNCNNLKSSLEKYIKKCDFASVDKQSFQDELDDIDCSQY